MPRETPVNTQLNDHVDDRPDEQPCPVRCPVCGESQNTLPGKFDPHAEPFGPVHCMVCGHAFTRAEYLSGLELRRRQLDAMRGPTE